MTGNRPTPLKPDALASTVHAFVPELRRIAELDFEVLFNQDSSDLHPEQIGEIASFLHARWGSYDGFVVIHGTDAMVHSASALAFLFRGLDKPVVLTGSQRPLAEIRSDAKPNLIAACTLAADEKPICEVGVFFGTELLRGCRAKKLRTAHFDAFASPNCLPLASLGVEIERGAHARGPGSGVAAPTPLSADLFAFRIFPGIDPAVPMRLLEGGVKGVVLEAFGAGNIATKGRPFAPFIREASARGVPVVLVTQCLHGAVDATLYEGGQQALDAGAIPGGDMTVEAALAKLSVLLGRGVTLADVRAAFREDWAGERT
jgi:L-asparaginase